MPLLLAVMAGLFFGVAASVEAKGKSKKKPPLQGTVVSVTSDSLTIAVDKKQEKTDQQPSQKSQPKRMTFACDARTRVMLKSPAGAKLVSPSALSIGDRVAIGGFVLGSGENKYPFAYIIEIESQPNSKRLPSFSPSSPSSPVSTIPSLSSMKP
jgi:hypothetical protein